MAIEKFDSVTVILCIEKIKDFLTSIPETFGKLETKKQMAFAAVNYLDSLSADSLAETGCSYKPVIPGIGNASQKKTKPKHFDKDDFNTCTNKPLLPNGF